MMPIQTANARPQVDLHIPRLAEVGRDLLTLSRSQRFVALTLPFVWTGAYAFFAAIGWWPAAIVAAAGYTFYSYGSTSHDLVHGNLGLPSWLTNVFLAFIELAGMRSGHAYRAAHLHHHAFFPDHDDVEAAGAHTSFTGALLQGPAHQVSIWRWALRYANRDRAWIIGEITAIACIAVASILISQVTPAPLVWVVLVVLGSWTFPFLTAWLVHDSQGADILQQTRRFRGNVAAIVFRNHLYHLEHHLYPRVPHQRWPELARRLDPFLDRAAVRPVVMKF
ncbi:MAG TPA: fatty acid desaturase [Pirellulales bacterium]|jgi:beta-carotene hydroxylase|nr:fatty acid desaturase [Pirellulales bacterium]